MAFMYTMHVPSVPFRWDDTLWTLEILPKEEEALLGSLEEKLAAQTAVSQYRSLSIPVCSQVRELSEDMEDDDDDDEDAEELSP